MNTGITPQKAIDLIRGTINPDNGKREGGVLDVSRSSASMIARTITNGVANEARLATLDENEDVIDGVQFLATLDGKTSFLCASLDGTIWLNKDRDKVKRPPLHPNCRSTLIPYIILHDENGNVIEDEDSRPMANADFDQYAREQYEKKYPGKKFSDLAQTTRDNYYYKAQKQYEKETGKLAYSQTSGKTTFKDYFENQPDDFKRSWLGEKRFELYKDGKLKFDQLVKPDSGYVVPVSELGQKDGPDHSNTGGNVTTPNVPTGPVVPATKPIGRTAAELKNPNPVLTVDDFKREFADKQATFDQEKLRLENELQAKKQAIDNNNNLTEQQKKDEKDVEDNQYKRIQGDLLDRHRDNIFDTIWPNLNPNSHNRERLAIEQVNNERFVPLKPDRLGRQRWYDIKKRYIVYDLPKSAKAKILGTQTDEHKEFFDKGKDFFGRIADSMGYDITDVIDHEEFYGIVDRGFHQPGLDRMRDNGKNIVVLSNKRERKTSATVVHELTHALEDNYPELKKKIAAFYVQITTQQNGIQSPKKRIPWLPSEFYRIPNITMMDKGGEYATKDDGSTVGVELLTHFFTEMIERPEEVIEKCPEWFNGMMSCLNQ